MEERAHPARWRRWALFGALGGAALLLGALWLAQSGAAGGRASDVAVSPPQQSSMAASAAAAMSPKTAQLHVRETPLDDLPEAVRRFLVSTPYPSTSGRLSPGQEDLLFPNRRYESPRPIPDTLGDDPDGVVTWLFTADRWAYVGPDTAHVLLEVRRGGTPAEVEVVSATATREGRAGAEGAPERLDFRRDGERLVADLPLARFADHFGAIVLDVRFEYAPGHLHADQLRIFSTPADRVPGRVTEVRDHLRDGSLVIDVGVEVTAPGFYRFDANLYDGQGEPVAFAVFKGDLEPGAQQVPLEVYGKVLRDAGIEGPYSVGEVRGYRFLDGQYPDREALPEVDVRFQTSTWPLDAFTDELYTSDHEIHMAELMLDDLAQGIPLLEPAPAADVVAPRPADDDDEPLVPDPKPTP